MDSLFCVLGLGFALAVLFTTAARDLAARVGLVDCPDGRRKTQAAPIPLGGGLAVLTATTLAVAVALVASPDFSAALLAAPHRLGGLLAGSVLIAVVGLLDDYNRLRGRHKLAGQILAIALVVFVGGVLIERITLLGCVIELGVFSVPLTFFWFLGAINALNLIDGMDGMLSSVGILVCLTVSALGLLAGHLEVACIAAALAGALLGFLVFNFPPASIYLGDCGSMVIGLVVGTLAIQGSLKGPTTVALATPVALLILPIFDTTAAIVRRKLTGRSVYTTDRGHLHHRLLSSGLTSRRVLLLLSSLGLVTGLGAFAASLWSNDLLAFLAAGAVVLILLTTKLFGYAEFLLIKEHVQSALSGVRSRGGDSRGLSVRLQGTADWAQVWEALVAEARGLDLQTLCLDVNAPALHENYHARWDRRGGEQEFPDLWRLEVPLAAGGAVVGKLTAGAKHGAVPLWERLPALARMAESAERAFVELASKHRNQNPAGGPGAGAGGEPPVPAPEPLTAV